jgi:type VI protein secretion system component VasF
MRQRPEKFGLAWQSAHAGKQKNNSNRRVTATIIESPKVLRPLLWVVVARSDSLALLFQEALTVVVRICAGRQRLGDPQVFRMQMRNALQAAEKAALAYGYIANDLRTVLEAMAAFLDESLRNAQSPEYAGLYEELFGIRGAGEGFLRNLDGFFERSDSLTVADLLEVHQLCLLLGFRAHLSSLEIRFLLRQIEEKIRRIRTARPTLPQSIHVSGSARTSESRPVTFLIGEAGSGKSSLIAESGIELEQATENVWLARDALLVEGDLGAGRRLLKRRDACSAIVTIDCGAFFVPERVEALAQGARDSRAALGEIARETRATLPVYVVFTKADKINFFAEFARNFTGLEAREPVGAAVHASVSEAFDTVYRLLADKRAKLLEREQDSEALANIFEFPREFAKLRPLVIEFLEELRGPAATLRGFYFTGVGAIHSSAEPQRLWLRRLFSDIVLADVPARKPPGSSDGLVATSRLRRMR